MITPEYPRSRQFQEWKVSDETGRQGNKPATAYGPYLKDTTRYNHIDIYRILTLYGITDHAIGHAVKKLLAAGQRGAKSRTQDLKEAIESIERQIEMDQEDAYQ